MACQEIVEAARAFSEDGPAEARPVVVVTPPSGPAAEWQDALEDDYDPRKPEYIIDADPEEVERQKHLLLEQQMARLEAHLARRSAKKRKSLEQVLHYGTVLDELRSHKDTLVGRTGRFLDTAQSFDLGEQPSIGRASHIHLSDERPRASSEPMDFEPARLCPEDPITCDTTPRKISSFRGHAVSTVSTTDCDLFGEGDRVDPALLAEQKARRMSRMMTSDSGSGWTTTPENDAAIEKVDEEFVDNQRARRLSRMTSNDSVGGWPIALENYPAIEKVDEEFVDNQRARRLSRMTSNDSVGGWPIAPENYPAIEKIDQEFVDNQRARRLSRMTSNDSVGGWPIALENYPAIEKVDEEFVDNQRARRLSRMTSNDSVGGWPTAPEKYPAIEKVDEEFVDNQRARRLSRMTSNNSTIEWQVSGLSKHSVEQEVSNPQEDGVHVDESYMHACGPL